MRLLQILALTLASMVGGSSTVPEGVQGSLAPTAHPPLPVALDDLWLVPPAGERAGRETGDLATAVRLYGEGNHETALAALNRLRGKGPLADYVELYRGLAHLRLKQVREARRALDDLAARRPQGAIGAAVALAQAEIAEADGDQRAAVAIYEQLAGEEHRVTEDVLARLGRAALAAGDRKTAAEAYVRIYYEFPLTTAATSAGSRLTELQDHIVRTGYSADIGRAAMLYGGRRFADAREAYQELRKHVGGDDRELADLRIAQCDFHLKRFAAARDALGPHMERGERQAEARFYYLSSLRELGQHAEYVSRARALVQEFPQSPWAAEALNDLGTHFIVVDQDDAAARVFGELYERFPTSSRAERAAWKFGWWSYRSGDYRTTVRVFESAAAAFPRSDYRPSFLYWAARAHGKLGAGAQAEARYHLVHADYGSSYYGRLAGRRVAVKPADRPVPASYASGTSAPAVPTAERIRLLLGHGLYDDALEELRYAQRQWGTNPALEATIAWAYHRKGELRRAITLMRRAYPQFLTATGEDLPMEVRQVIFPLVYWDLIRKQAATHKLDPYLMAALIAQESTFEPTARSVANAVGLMQVLPATGRRLARSAGMRGFSPRMLTTPETNIRLGMFYFARLVERFGGAHYALASYNAGENRVVRWKAERPDLEDDEFIDDIPYPETQNYVKRILGTAEDYRLLYGRDGGRPLSTTGLPR